MVAFNYDAKVRAGVPGLGVAHKRFTEACEKHGKETILSEFNAVFAKFEMVPDFALHLSHRHSEHSEAQVQVEKSSGCDPVAGAVVTRSGPHSARFLPGMIPIVWVVHETGRGARFLPIEYAEDDGTALMDTFKEQGEKLFKATDFAQEFWAVQGQLQTLWQCPVFGVALLNPRKRHDACLAVETSDTEHGEEIVTLVPAKEVDLKSTSIIEAAWEMTGPWTQACHQWCTWVQRCCYDMDAAQHCETGAHCLDHR